MDFLRNREIRRQLAGSCFLLVLTGAGIFFLPALLGMEVWAGDGRLFLFFEGAMALLVFYWLWFTLKRYRRLQRLAADSDRILHGEREIRLEQYQEGELSILANEFQKMLARLVEQSDVLQREKVYLSDSMADISHQLKTPLTALHLLFMRLSGEQREEERSRLVYEGVQLLERVDWLVNGLLKIARIDAGTAVFAQERVDVEELLELALRPLRIPLELREQTVTVLSGEEGERPCFVGDLSWSGEALGNILKNCMEHTPRGGNIRILSRENQLYTEIMVEDNGSGVDPEDLPHLFERFYRGKNAGKDSFGIGLALAQMILSRENAVIQAQNAPEGGGQFRIRFYKTMI